MFLLHVEFKNTKVVLINCNNSSYKSRWMKMSSRTLMKVKMTTTKFSRMRKKGFLSIYYNDRKDLFSYKKYSKLPGLKDQQVGKSCPNDTPLPKKLMTHSLQ